MEEIKDHDNEHTDTSHAMVNVPIITIDIDALDRRIAETATTE